MYHCYQEYERSENVSKRNVKHIYSFQGLNSAAPRDSVTNHIRKFNYARAQVKKTNSEPPGKVKKTYSLTIHILFILLYTIQVQKQVKGKNSVALRSIM